MTDNLREDLYMLAVQMERDGVPEERQWFIAACIIQWLVWDVLSEEAFIMIATWWGKFNQPSLEYIQTPRS